MCSIQLLEITKAERGKAPKKYESHREMVKETVAFGRRVDGPPTKVYTPPPTFDSFGFDNGRCTFYTECLHTGRKRKSICQSVYIKSLLF